MNRPTSQVGPAGCRAVLCRPIWSRVRLGVPIIIARSRFKCLRSIKHHPASAGESRPYRAGGLSASADGGDDEQEPTILSGRSISPDRLRDHIGTQNVNDSVALVGKLPVALGVTFFVFKSHTFTVFRRCLLNHASVFPSGEKTMDSTIWLRAVYDRISFPVFLFHSVIVQSRYTRALP